MHEHRADEKVPGDAFGLEDGENGWFHFVTCASVAGKQANRKEQDDDTAERNIPNLLTELKPVLSSE